MQYIVKTYGLDGIDIDDEYSNGVVVENSLAMVTTFIRQMMPTVIISKALWNDFSNFRATYNDTSLGQNLTYGWQMSYGSSPSNTLPPYLQFQMSQEQLFQGFWAGQPSQSPSDDIAWLRQNVYGGMMVYNFNSSDNLNLMGALVNSWYGSGNWNKRLNPIGGTFLLMEDESKVVGSPVATSFSGLNRSLKNLNAEEIIAAINEDPKGTTGFNDDDLQNFIIDNGYDLLNNPQRLRQEILTYRVRNQKLKDAIKYATYGVSLLITAFGTAGIQLSRTNTETTPTTVTSAITAALGIIVFLIKGICEPWVESNEKALKRLEAVAIYAKNQKLLLIKRHEVAGGHHSEFETQLIRPTERAAALAGSMARSVLRGVDPRERELKPMPPPVSTEQGDRALRPAIMEGP